MNNCIHCAAGLQVCLWPEVVSVTSKMVTAEASTLSFTYSYSEPSGGCHIDYIHVLYRLQILLLKHLVMSWWFYCNSCWCCIPFSPTLVHHVHVIEIIQIADIQVIDPEWILSKLHLDHPETIKLMKAVKRVCLQTKAAS